MNRLKRTPSYGLGNVLLKKLVKGVKHVPELITSSPLKKASKEASEEMYKQYTDPEFFKRVNSLKLKQEQEVALQLKNNANELFFLPDLFSTSLKEVADQTANRLIPSKNKINFFSPSEFAKKIDSGGYYRHDNLLDPAKGNFIKVNPLVPNKKSLLIHELTHQATDGSRLLPSSVKELLKSPFYKNIDDLPIGKQKQYKSTDYFKHNDNTTFDYLLEPTEIHARVNEIRHTLNPKNPWKKLEYSDMSKIKEIGKKRAKEDLTEMLGLIKDDKQFIDMVNKMYTPAAIAAAGTLGLAASQGDYKKGGTLKLKFKSGGSVKDNMSCNSPKRTPDHRTKSHVVLACESGKKKLIRFGQQGVKGSPKKEGESEAYANRRKSFKARHAKNINKGKMSAAYWSDKIKW